MCQDNHRALSLIAIHEQGLPIIKHTDGNIMPIIEQLIDAQPDALHSLDPQGGVDIAAVKRGSSICAT